MTEPHVWTLDELERAGRKRGGHLIWPRTPRIRHDGQSWSLSRLAWLLRHGSVPDASQRIVHTCARLDCYAAEHLDVKPVGEIIRAQWIKRSPTSCPYGHAYTKDNTYRVPKTGYRHCRTCHRENVAASRL